MVRAGNAEFVTGHWGPAHRRARRGAYLGHGDGAYVMNTRLLLIRHGETTSNVSGELDTGAPGAQLTTLGRRQASGAATALARGAVGSARGSQLVPTWPPAGPLVSPRNIGSAVCCVRTDRRADRQRTQYRRRNCSGARRNQRR